MGDAEDRFLDETIEDASESDAGPRTGFLPAAVITLLRYAAIAIGIIVVAATTAYITFQLISQGSITNDLTLVSPEFQAKQDPLGYNDTIELIRGVTSDDPPEIFSVRVSIGYNLNDTGISEEVTKRQREIQHLVFLYLSQKRASELQPQFYSQLAEDLKQRINQRLQAGKIGAVYFREFVVAP